MLRRVASFPLAARFIRLRADFRIDSADAFFVQMGMLTVAFFRGLDYVAMPADTVPAVLSSVERAAPLDTWGYLFILCAAVGAVGAHFGRWRVCAVGHGLLVAVYVVFGIGSLADVLERASLTDSSLFGFRTGLGWIVGAAVVHAALYRSSMNAWRSANAR
ncbi:hypothetical protein [Rhodococcoides kroppenstedtii]|uniref:hypothetical protein n=1 Tax=Rhodococcoides kroppenstedtii TaxID=293050 RepID=UPI001114647D|nr:hypothetical protein [Rhodococcus kroppenstedtii]